MKNVEIGKIKTMTINTFYTTLHGPSRKGYGEVMGPGQIFVARAGSGQVSHLRFGFGKFPLKMSNFLLLFPSGQKKSLWVRSKSSRVKGSSNSYLLRVKRKLRSGQVKAHL